MTKVTAFDKLKLKGVKMALEAGMDYLEPGIEKLIELKAQVPLQDDETTVILIGYLNANNEAYGSVCTINDMNQIKRQIFTAPINELASQLTKLI